MIAPDSIPCSLCGQPIPRIPARDSAGEPTVYTLLGARYRGLWGRESRLAICLDCDGGDRRDPTNGFLLEPLCEADLALAHPPPSTPALPAWPEALTDWLKRWPHVEAVAQWDRLVAETPESLLDAFAAAVSWEQLFELEQSTVVLGKPRRETVPGGWTGALWLVQALGRNLPETSATTTLRDSLAAWAHTRRLTRLPETPFLTRRCDRQLLPNRVRTQLSAVANQWFRKQWHRAAVALFALLVADAPDDTEARYSLAIAHSSIAAHPQARWQDRVKAVAAFDGFLRCAETNQNLERMETITYLRRQLLGVRSEPPA